MLAAILPVAFVTLLDFSSDPTTLGWTAQGAAASHLNTAAGTWGGSYAAGDIAYWQRDVTLDAAAGLVTGEARLTTTSLSSSGPDQTITYLSQAPGASNVWFDLDLVGTSGGQLKLFRRPGLGDVVVDTFAPGATEHVYKWVLNLGARTLDVYRDGALKGSGYDVSNLDSVPDNRIYFGDGTFGGAHAENWNSIAISQPVPEPGLLSPALALLAAAWASRAPASSSRRGGA